MSYDTRNNPTAASELEWSAPNRSSLVQAQVLAARSQGISLADRVADAVRDLRAGQDSDGRSVDLLDRSDLSDAPYVSDSLVEGSGVIANPRAYMFLDVDGIINPMAGELYGDWQIYKIGRFEVWQSDSVSAWLNSLIDQGVQIVWATTWVESPANLDELSILWDLPADLPRINGLSWPTVEERFYDCGKAPGVNDWLNDNNVDSAVTPIAWVDDMLGPGDQRFARTWDINPVFVEPYYGLANPMVRDQIERIVLS
jgi:hypothetical protein